MGTTSKHSQGSWSDCHEVIHRSCASTSSTHQDVSVSVDASRLKQEPQLVLLSAPPLSEPDKLPLLALLWSHLVGCATMEWVLLQKQVQSTRLLSGRHTSKSESETRTCTLVGLCLQPQALHMPSHKTQH